MLNTAGFGQFDHREAIGPQAPLRVVRLAERAFDRAVLRLALAVA